MGDKRGSEWAQEEELRAVVLADSFNERFMPATRDQPRALLPLANIPLIEYTLEFLGAGGVKEIIVCTKSHAEKIQEYLAHSRWSKGSVEVTVLEFGEAIAPGDVLRELFGRQIVRSEFVLVTGDVVSNMSLDKVVEAHRARARKDKHNVATITFTEQHPRHLTRSREEGLVVTLDASTGQLLDYKRTNKVHGMVPVPIAVFENARCVDVRADLVDADIYVCSPVVLELFCDNFDYEDLPTFIRGVLQDEIRGDRLHTHVLTNEYAARVTNLRMYDAVSRDVLRRWTTPVVPDANIVNDSYTYHRGNVYMDTNVSLARPVRLGRDVMLGANTTVGGNTRIENSVIGRGCRIGANCVIKDSYIWADTQIGNNCSVSRAILCDRVVLQDNVTVKEGALLAYDVVIGAGHTVPVRTKITAHRVADEGFSEDESDDNFDEDDEDEGVGGGKGSGTGGWNPAHVGKGGLGAVWSTEVDSDDSDVDDFAEGRKAIEVRALSDLSDGEDSDDSEEDEPIVVDAQEQFYREVLESVRGAAEGSNPQGVMVEINASKHAYNVPPAQVMEAVIRGSLEDGNGMDIKQLKIRSKKTFTKLKPLIQNYIRTGEQQVQAVTVLAEYCIEHVSYADMLQTMLHLLYNEDVIEEDAIFEWYQSCESATDKLALQRRKVAPLIEWLENAEEDDSDDE